MYPLPGESLKKGLHMGKLLDEMLGEIKTCVFTKAVIALPEVDQKDLAEILPNPTVTSTQIARALERRGFKVGLTSVLLHRKGECCCE